MWNSRLAASARPYTDATLTVVESSGYPFSVRCRPVLDDRREVIAFTTISAPATSWRGTACLLFHRHDERLENQYQLLIRGHLAEQDHVLILRPTAFVTGTGSRESDRMPHAGAPLQLLRFMLLGRRQAAAYLRRRKEPWPAVDFGPMLRVLSELHRHPDDNST